MRLLTLIFFVSIMIFFDVAFAHADNQSSQWKTSLINEVISDSQRQQFFCKGKANGIYQRFYKNGALYQKINCQNEMLEGKLDQYRADSTLAVKAHYRKNLLDGVYEKYDDKKNVIEKVIYKAGKKDEAAENSLSKDNKAPIEPYQTFSKAAQSTQINGDKKALSINNQGAKVRQLRENNGTKSQFWP